MASQREKIIARDRNHLKQLIYESSSSDRRTDLYLRPEFH